ncbi:hypothetical protein CHS0354_031280 [Potamilus streckersoni]|uniref:C-type lectin domain-containing protein n=1 Tax=Potamilus streckersoni TaxID=2493646 RepID=A0AAE0TDA5_9BIVA|nr:hypothetical protein CHS0354_031280 [Potamilus streckersoni]
MLLAMFTIFFQFQRACMIFETLTGNKTLFTRGSAQLSWIAAREACDNMSHAMLSGMRDERAFGLLDVGEFAWIDGKEYSFCYAKNGNETMEICRYVTVRREDTRNNHTSICNKGGNFQMNTNILSYNDAINKCLMLSASLQLVETFAVPMLFPVNKTYWIKDYNVTSIINTLRPGENVTEICIGIVKIGHNKFEFGTTSCDENHTVICDATCQHSAKFARNGVVDTALTLTTREEMMPRLGDLKASNQSQADNLIFIVLYSTLWILPFTISIVAIVQHRKKRLNKTIANNSIYRTQRSHAKRRQEDRGMLPEHHCLRWNIKSESKSLPCNSTQAQGNRPGDASDDQCDNNINPQFDLYENPISNKNSTSSHHIQQNADSQLDLYENPISNYNSTSSHHIQKNVDPQLDLYLNPISNYNSTSSHHIQKNATLCNEVYDHLDSQLGLYENPINADTFTSRYHIQGHALLAKQVALSKKAKSSKNENGLFPPRESDHSQTCMSMYANERDRTIGMDTENENLYENFN